MSTLIFCDSFYHYTVDQMGPATGGKWDAGSVGADSIIQNGRYAFTRGFTGTAVKTFLEDDNLTTATFSEITCGYNWSPNYGNVVDLPITINGSGISFGFINNGDNTFTAQLIVGSTVYTDTQKTTFVVAYDQWHEFEYRVHVLSSTVTWALWVDGVQLLSGTFTVTTSAVFSNIICDSSGGVIADLYVTDSYLMSTTNGTWRILVLNTTDNGGADGFTPLANENWQEVMDNPPDEDVSYNYATSEKKDLYEYSQIGLTPVPTVLGVQIVARVKNVDADDAGCQIPLVSESTEIDYPASGTIEVDNSTYSFYCKALLQNPVTSAAWTMDDINAIQAGFILVDLGGGSATVPSNVTQMQMGVNQPYSAEADMAGGFTYPPLTGVGNGFVVKVTGPKTGGGSVTVTKTVAITQQGEDEVYPYTYPPPWMEFSGQNPLTGGSTGLEAPSAYTDWCPVCVTHSGDDFAFAEGDVIEWSVTGSIGINHISGQNRTVGEGYSGPALVIPGGFDSLAAGTGGGFYFGSLWEAYDNTVLPPNYDNANYDPSTGLAGGVATPCAVCSTQGLGIGGLVGCFAGNNQSTQNGTGIIQGTPFIMGTGGRGIVPGS